MSMIIEKDAESMTQIYPLVLGVMHYWGLHKIILNQMDNTIFTTIVQNFIARVRVNAPDVAALSFLLSPKGRNLIQSQNIHFESGEGDEFTSDSLFNNFLILLNINYVNLDGEFIYNLEGTMVGNEFVSLRNVANDSESVNETVNGMESNSNELRSLIQRDLSDPGTDLAESLPNEDVHFIDMDRPRAQSNSTRRIRRAINDYFQPLPKELADSIPIETQVEQRSGTTNEEPNPIPLIEAVEINSATDLIEKDEKDLDVVSTTMYKKEMEAITGLDIDNLLALDIYGDIVCRAETELKRFGDFKGFDSLDMKDLLHKWLKYNAEEFPFQDLLNLDSNRIWRRAHTYKEWKTFSEISIIYSSLGTSEAEIERLISLHRVIVGDRSTNIGNETLQACLRLYNHPI